MRIFVVLLLIVSATPVRAEIALTALQNFSEIINFEPGGVNASLVVYGGVAGSDSASSCATSINPSVPCCANKNGNSPCNSCVLGSSGLSNTPACNKNRVYSGLPLRITFSSNSIDRGTPMITFTNSTSGQTAITSTSLPVQTTVTGEVITLSVDWNNICAAMGGTSGCSGVRSFINVRVGVSTANDGILDGTDDSISFQIKVIDPDAAFSTPNSTSTDLGDSAGGFTGFSLTKGDQKAEIENLVLSPTGIGAVYRHVYFYCSDTSFNDITIADQCTDRVLITGTNALTDTAITGLANGVTYYFHAGIVDEAGNIGRFLVHQDARYTVTPEEVVGLFRETDCFIATVAYGSPLQKQVQSLRRFRDEVLQKSVVGRLFITLYYSLSPPLARWISQTSERRSWARTALSPVITLTSFTTQHPRGSCAVLISMMFFLALGLRGSREVQP